MELDVGPQLPAGWRLTLGVTQGPELGEGDLLLGKPWAEH